ncbi:MAG TPA: nucleoside-diphosphate kinase [Chloroflexi bacterium]|jgi:nucleoside-diphosphate kinase|nr:nucleoside-diphosphate kinase [Chloroflexota bacterium]
MADVPRTLVIIKPDAVQRQLAGVILSRLEQKGLRFVGLKLIQIDKPLAERHYAVHQGKPFYEGLVSFITSAPVVVAVVEGPDAIEATRGIMGATNPVTADPGSIRGEYALEIGQNLIHGSDSQETAEYEIDLYFKRDELLQYRRDVDRWIAG